MRNCVNRFSIPLQLNHNPLPSQLQYSQIFRAIKIPLPIIGSIILQIYTPNVSVISQFRRSLLNNYGCKAALSVSSNEVSVGGVTTAATSRSGKRWLAREWLVCCIPALCNERDDLLNTVSAARRQRLGRDVRMSGRQTACIPRAARSSLNVLCAVVPARISTDVATRRASGGSSRNASARNAWYANANAAQGFPLRACTRAAATARPAMSQRVVACCLIEYYEWQKRKLP